MQQPEPHRDDWLSNVLGFDAWTVAAPNESAHALVTLRVPTRDIEAVREAEAHGFAVIDVNVTLERTGGEGVAEGVFPVAPATPEEGAALVEVAGSCFNTSRFHLDPRIPREAANAVKREWVRSYVERRRGIELLAVRTDGFLAVLAAGDGARVIDLVGVAPAAQGRGVGESLVAAFVRRHGVDGRTLRVGTQVSNVRSLRLYERAGFTIVATSYVLHRHVGA